jgi:Family of unknown function (DUF6308)
VEHTVCVARLDEAAMGSREDQARLAPTRAGGEPFFAADALLTAHEVPPDAAAKILITEPDRFNSLLRDIPWSQDIWHLEVRRLDLDVGRKASDFHELLRSDAVPDIGWVTTS